MRTRRSIPISAAKGTPQLNGQPGAGGSGQPVANFNYFGTQYPTVEQRAMQRRDFALMLSGAR